MRNTVGNSTNITNTQIDTAANIEYSIVWHFTVGSKYKTHFLGRSRLFIGWTINNSVNDKVKSLKKTEEGML